MNNMSQMDAMRDLIRTELVPRIVKQVVKGAPLWVCELCAVETPVDEEYTAATMAKHTTFCKLGNVLEVIE